MDLQNSSLTRKELADILHISVQTISKWNKQGCPVVLAGTRTTFGQGTKLLYNLEEVKQWLKARTEAARAKMTAAGRGVEQ